MENIVVIFLVICVLLVAVVYLYARENKAAQVEIADLEKSNEGFKSKYLEAVTASKAMANDISSMKQVCTVLEDKVSENFTRFTKELGALKKEVDQYRDEALMTRKSKHRGVTALVREMPKTIEADVYPKQVLKTKKRRN